MSGNFYCEGVDKAPQRSLFHALGMTKEEMERPLVGIVSSYNEIVPGHMNIDKIVDAVKMGVAMAGGTPVVFPAIAVCDGIAMGHKGMKYSLVTRDLIADSTECMALAHHFDALVMIPNCDKNVPGLLMAAARVNVPTVFVSGGPMLAGHVKGKKTSLSSMFEAVGSYAAGKFTMEDVEEFENNACPTCGSCSGMYTANSMNCLTEVLGMGLKGNGTIPAVYSERIKLAKQAGMAVMDMYRKNIRPRDIMTADAFENALTADMALGCSTNSMLHLPAIANECGIKIDLDMVNKISARTPNICHLAPAGHAYMEDLNEAGGIYAVLNELTKKNLLHTDVMTVTGKTMAENIKGCINKNTDIIRPIDQPYSETGGIAVLKGNLAPDRCVVKRSAVAKEMLVHKGPAKVFNSEEEAIAAITGGKIVKGDVPVTAVWLSSAMKDLPAARVCVRCCPRPLPSQAWVWTRTLPSSQTAVSPVRLVAQPSVTFLRRLSTAAPSPMYRTAISSPSTSRTTASSWRSLTRSWQSGKRPPRSWSRKTSPAI